MKHSRLHGVAHNLADSLASGISFVFGYCATSVFAEAAANKDGFLVVDFLHGTVDGAYPDGELAHAVPLFKNAFPAFCEKHGVDVSDYSAFLVRYIADHMGGGYIVTIEDRDGYRTSRAYSGNPGKRTMSLDDRGRRRPKVLAVPVD